MVNINSDNNNCDHGDCPISDVNRRVKLTRALFQLNPEQIRTVQKTQAVILAQVLLVKAETLQDTQALPPHQQLSEMLLTSSCPRARQPGEVVTGAN